MKQAALLLLWLLALPGAAAGAEFPAAQAAEVVAAALEFMAPRTLDTVGIPQLATWGLRGVNALDPALTAELRGSDLVLAAGTRVLFTRPAPTEATGKEWARATADIYAAAWSLSDAVRRAGLTGALQSFFDEVFNHFDAYSRYVPPAAAGQDRDTRTGEAGIGVALVRQGAFVAIKSMNADGTGAESGLDVGERILEVDGQSTRNRDAETVQGWLAGDDGTVVSLLIRGRNGQVRPVEVEREAIPPETVFASRSGDLAVLRISMFSADTDRRLAHELDGIANLPPRSRVQALVLDLRGNRGGLLRQAVDASRLLLGRALVATTEGRNPQASRVWQADGEDMVPGLPVLVLVDGRTASAAEIMAAALADQGRAVVVGSVTLGKGLVQTIAQLPDGGELFVTWSRVLAPLGWPIQGLGVLPQVCTSLGEERTQAQLASLAQGRMLMAPAVDAERRARAPLPAARIVELRQPCPASEGRDADLATARWLAGHPAAYAAALLTPPSARR